MEQPPPRAQPLIMNRPLITPPGDWKHTAHNLFFRPSSSPRARILHVCTCGLILLSTACFVLQTVPAVASWGGWGLLDGLITVIFTFEYGARLYVAPYGRGDEEEETAPPPPSHSAARRRFARQPLTLIDLLAILPFWLEFLLPFLPAFFFFPVAVVRSLRLVRVLRLLRLAQASSELQTLVLCASRLWSVLRLLLFFLALTTTIIGGLVFHAEASTLDDGVWMREEGVRSDFQSIPEAAWWCLVTVTAVGCAVPGTLPCVCTSSVACAQTTS